METTGNQLSRRRKERVKKIRSLKLLLMVRNRTLKRKEMQRKLKRQTRRLPISLQNLMTRQRLKMKDLIFQVASMEFRR